MDKFELSAWSSDLMVTNNDSSECTNNANVWVAASKPTSGGKKPGSGGKKPGSGKKKPGNRKKKPS